MKSMGKGSKLPNMEVHMAEEQLRMVRGNPDGLPELVIPDGYGLRTYLPGDEAAWAAIMNTGIGEWTADSCIEKLTSQPQFLPEGLFFATFEDLPVGSACAWRASADEERSGYLHMVCVLPEHRGKQLGYLVTLAVLRFFRDHGFAEVVLTTDDWRIAAIKAYLRLGFEPCYPDDSHRERWRLIMEKIEGGQ
jgi:mycothiol synthase